jgi:hypothetical protein
LRALFLLLAKDFRRDLKQPWSLVLFAILPVVMTGLMATIFGGPQGSAGVPAIRVAVLDEDRGPLADALRFLVTKQAGRDVQVHFVPDRDQGLRLLERGEASVLVVLPPKTTENLVSGRPSTIEVYENLAEQYLPKIIHQQVSMLADALSEAADGLRDGWRNVWGVLHFLSLPTRVAVVQVAWQCTERLFRHQVAAPSIELETISAAEYRPQAKLPPVKSRPGMGKRAGETSPASPEKPSQLSHHPPRNP